MQLPEARHIEAIVEQWGLGPHRSLCMRGAERNIILALVLVKGYLKLEGSFAATGSVPGLWREMSTDRLWCYYNWLHKILTSFDDFLTSFDEF
jgi:hypothetical protein